MRRPEPALSFKSIHQGEKRKLILNQSHLSLEMHPFRVISNHIYPKIIAIPFVTLVCHCIKTMLANRTDPNQTTTSSLRQDYIVCSYKNDTQQTMERAIKPLLT